MHEALLWFPRTRWEVFLSIVDPHRIAKKSPKATRSSPSIPSRLVVAGLQQQRWAFDSAGRNFWSDLVAGQGQFGHHALTAVSLKSSRGPPPRCPGRGTGKNQVGLHTLDDAGGTTSRPGCSRYTRGSCCSAPLECLIGGGKALLTPVKVPRRRERCALSHERHRQRIGRGGAWRGLSLWWADCMRDSTGRESNSGLVGNVPSWATKGSSRCRYASWWWSATRTSRGRDTQ